MQISNLKREKGIFYTEGNPFALKPFKNWAERIKLNERVILEPFAGKNNIIKTLENLNFCSDFVAYDICPNDKNVQKLDTIKNFPTNFEVCVTNPPWLAKNSAKRRGLYFPKNTFDDLYKHCLDLCLSNCPYVAAIIPATFLQSNYFRNRLDTFILIHNKQLFSETDNPAALALFTEKSQNIKIYYDNKFIGNLKDLEKKLPKVQSPKKKVTFNVNDGELGFIAFDDTKKPSIRFCLGSCLNNYKISHSSRMITKIKLDSIKNLQFFIDKLNTQIKEFREETRDVFLTPFKGLRIDNKYRRRMRYSIARDFILSNV